MKIYDILNYIWQHGHVWYDLIASQSEKQGKTMYYARLPRSHGMSSVRREVWIPSQNLYQVSTCSHVQFRWLPWLGSKWWFSCSRAEDVAWFSQEGYYSPIRIALSVQVYNYCISVYLRSHIRYSIFTHSVDLRYFRLACSAGRCHAGTSEWGHWFPIKEGLKGVAIAEFHTDMTESVQGLQCQEWSWKYFDSFWFVVLPLLPFNSMPFPFYNPVGLHGLSIFAPMERCQWSQSDAWRATGNRLCSFTFYGKKVTPLREEKVALKVWNNWQAHVAYGSQSNYQICIR